MPNTLAVSSTIRTVIFSGIISSSWASVPWSLARSSALLSNVPSLSTDISELSNNASRAALSFRFCASNLANSSIRSFAASPEVESNSTSCAEIKAAVAQKQRMMNEIGNAFIRKPENHLLSRGSVPHSRGHARDADPLARFVQPGVHETAIALIRLTICEPSQPHYACDDHSVLVAASHLGLNHNLHRAHRFGVCQHLGLAHQSAVNVHIGKRIIKD